MGDIDYQDYQNLAETLAGDQVAGTVAQYTSMIKDPEMLGQHLLSDAGAFMLHDKVRDGIKGIGKALNFSEDDITGLMGEIGSGASSAVGAIGKLSKDIKGALNDRFGDYAKRFRGHTSPENEVIQPRQDLSEFADEAVARIPGGRTHGLLPFETQRAEDEFSSSANPAAARSVGAPNPQAEEEATQQREAGASEPEQSDLDRLTDEDAESLFRPPPPTGAQDMQNAANPGNDTSAANDANSRNANDQDPDQNLKDDAEKDLKRGAEKDVEEDSAEAALDIDPVTAVIGLGALIGSCFLHPHQEKEIAKPTVGTNYSVQIGA